MSSIGWVFGVLKGYGVNTKGMSVEDAFEKLNELEPNKGKREKPEPKKVDREKQEEKLDALRRKVEGDSPSDSGLSDEENKKLSEYQIPKEPIVRKPQDAEKWEVYDKDYETYKTKEPAITADIDAISKETGMPLIGRDYRLKGKGSYDRKVNDKRLNGEYKPLGDVVRYTFEHSMDNAPKEINANLNKLREKGYKVVAVDNKWKNSGAYNGINVDVISPSGVPMEIQYMTTDNHKIKEEMHRYYEISRDKRTPEHIRDLAERKMREISKLWKRPKGIEEV